MGLAAQRLKLRTTGKAELAQLMDHRKNVLVIHYSCESFYERTQASSPRITSIAVRNFANAQTASFSIHQIAERNAVSGAAVETEYNRLERLMLDEFYQHVQTHQDQTWVHWNMRDINFGFKAIAHRYKVLGGTPLEVHDSNLVDLARLLISLYGRNYSPDPRLMNLVKMNEMDHVDFLSGKDEAAAFEGREYVKLHQSTLRKVHVMANILEALGAGKLKTKATVADIYGSRFGAAMEMVQAHWIIAVIGAAASIFGIADFCWNHFILPTKKG